MVFKYGYSAAFARATEYVNAPGRVKKVKSVYTNGTRKSFEKTAVFPVKRARCNPRRGSNRVRRLDDGNRRHVYAPATYVISMAPRM